MYSNELQSTDSAFPDTQTFHDLGYEKSVGPAISVVITCHSRKEFIIEAFESVLKQDFPREMFELIVVKNFQDEDIDDKLLSGGTVLILEEGKSFGLKISRGIERARGRIVCFLDDDDVWESGKLSRVYELFKDEDLIYYHNNEKFVDASLRPVDGGMPIEIRRINEMNSIRVSTKSSRRLLGELYGIYGDFNISSISIRTDFLHDNIEVIRDHSTALDSLLFYLCLASGKDVLVDSVPLTLYRKHGSNISLNSNGVNAGKSVSRNNFPIRRANAFKDIYETVARLGNEKISGLILPLSYGFLILSKIAEVETKRTEILRLVIRYLRKTNLFLIRYRKDFLFYGLSYLISPKHCRLLYFSRNR